jgi:hypothetical protein
MALLKMDLGEREGEIAKFKEKQVEFNTKAAKQQQIVEFLNKDIAKLQKQGEELTSTVKSKEENEERLRQ